MSGKKPEGSNLTSTDWEEVSRREKRMKKALESGRYEDCLDYYTRPILKGIWWDFDDWGREKVEKFRWKVIEMRDKITMHFICGIEEGG